MRAGRPRRGGGRGSTCDLYPFGPPPDRADDVAVGRAVGGGVGEQDAEDQAKLLAAQDHRPAFAGWLHERERRSRSAAAGPAGPLLGDRLAGRSRSARRARSRLRCAPGSAGRRRCAPPPGRPPTSRKKASHRSAGLRPAAADIGEAAQLGDLGAQLVGDIAREAALALEGVLQAGQQAVELVDDRDQLQGGRLDIDRRPSRSASSAVTWRWTAASGARPRGPRCRSAAPGAAASSAAAPNARRRASGSGSRAPRGCARPRARPSTACPGGLSPRSDGTRRSRPCGRGGRRQPEIGQAQLVGRGARQVAAVSESERATTVPSVARPGSLRSSVAWKSGMRSWANSNSISPLLPLGDARRVLAAARRARS